MEILIILKEPNDNKSVSITYNKIRSKRSGWIKIWRFEDTY